MTEKGPLPKEFQDWPGHSGNWHRWPNDRGALNFVDSSAVLRGVKAVIDGTVIPCARPMTSADPIIPDPVFRHDMICAGRVPHWPERLVQNASDSIFAWMHGTANTHIDALSHIAFKGIGFNGRPHTEMVSMEDGVTVCDVTAALGVVTRGLFVDVPAARGVQCLAPGDYVRPDEIADAIESAQRGDAVLIRTGCSVSGGRVNDDSDDAHGEWPGLHPDCVDQLGEKGVAILGTDGPGDCYPSPIKEHCDSPVHVLSLAVWGIHLVHNMDLEKLAETCAKTGRTEFLFMVNALNIPHATGSLTTPLAVL